MTTLKKINKKYSGISFVLAALMFLQAAVPLTTLAAYEVRQGAWIEGHIDENGPYGPEWVPGHYDWIVVEVPDKDANGDTKDPIDTVSGNNHFMEERLSVPCPGIPLVFNLEYSSLPEDQSAGSFGTNWVHSYEWTVNVESNQGVSIATVHAGTEGAVTFVLADSNGLFQAAVRNWTMETSTNGYAVHLPSGMDYAFNTTGRLDRIQDVWGNQVVCSYGTNDCLEAVTHSNGRSLVFGNSWDAAYGTWQVDSVAVVGGASLAFSYGADGQFTQIVEQVDANSYTSSYHYADGYLTNRINGAGFNYVYEYGETNGVMNGKGSHLSVDGYYVHDVDYVSNDVTDVTYQSRGLDQVYRYSRNADNRLEAQYGPAATGNAAASLGTRYAYSADGTDRTGETIFDDSTGASWSSWSLYDDMHNVTNYAVSYCSTNPVQRYSMEYDPQWHLPVSMTEPDGSHNETVYTNGLPLVEKAFYSETGSYDTRYAYFTNGLLRAVTNANDHATQYTYDSNGYLATTMAELGPITSNTCSTLGYVMRTDLLAEDGTSTGRTTVYERDAKGRAERIDYADGNHETFAYNAIGYLTNQTDRAGRATEYTYAPTKQLTSVTRYLNQNGSNVAVRIGYDLDEQLNTLRISEPRGRYVESYQMDLQDRVTAVTNIEGQVMSISYTVGDFVDHRERFDGSTIDYAYDNAGQQTNQTYRTAGGALTASIDMDYWTDGLVKSTSDGFSTISNAYDLLNRLTNQVVQVGNLQSEIINAFDPVGNVTNTVVSVGGSQASATEYSYDAAERLETISTTEGTEEAQSFVYAYNPENGLVESVSNTVSGITCSYQYDIMDRATNIAYRASDGSLIRSLGYTYDSAGMIRTKKIADDTSSFVKHTYAYDSIDRLVGETRSGSASSAYSAVYDYDLAGNRLSKTLNNSTTVNYQLGNGNRLASSSTTITTNSLFVSGNSSENIGLDDRWGELYVSNATAGASVTPSVSGSGFHATVPALAGQTNTVVAAIRDAAGNMDYVTKDYWVGTASGSTNNTRSYAYDAAGCLTNLNGASLEWDERYRLTSVDDASSFIAYEYDVLGQRTARIEGANVERYIYDDQQIVADLDGTGNLLRTYVWGDGIDNLLSMTVYGTSSTNTYYAIKDHQNSVLALTDASGSVVEFYEYDAYGNTTIRNVSGNELTESAIGNRYLFQGREYDSITGLYYFRARWYDPDAGRWLSKDPIGIEGGLNLYEFCDNNPANTIDPYGEFGFLGAIVGAVVGAATDIALQAAGNVLAGESAFSNIDYTSVAASAALGAVSGAIGAGLGAQAQKGAKAVKQLNRMNKNLNARKAATAAGKFRNPAKTLAQQQARNQAAGDLARAAGTATASTMVKNKVHGSLDCQ